MKFLPTDEEQEVTRTWRIETWAFWLGVYSHLLKKDKEKYANLSE